MSCCGRGCSTPTFDGGVCDFRHLEWVKRVETARVVWLKVRVEEYQWAWTAVQRAKERQDERGRGVLDKELVRQRVL